MNLTARRLKRKATEQASYIEDDANNGWKGNSNADKERKQLR